MQLDETYYLKNNDAQFVTNFFSETEGVEQTHLLMSQLDKPEEVMWKLVSKQAMENFFSDEGSSPEKLEIKTISESEASRIREHAKES